MYLCDSQVCSQVRLEISVALPETSLHSDLDYKTKTIILLKNITHDLIFMLKKMIWEDRYSQGEHTTPQQVEGERGRETLTEQVEETILLYLIGQHLIAFIINTHQFDPSITLQGSTNCKYLLLAFDHSCFHHYSSRCLGSCSAIVTLSLNAHCILSKARKTRMVIKSFH